LKRIRADARWSVPEPELALVTNARGRARRFPGDHPAYLGGGESV